jgi:hypothetical protein
MRESSDKEIDSLLRRHAGVVAGGRARGDIDSSASGEGAHLDVDELSAFAEGALPASARVAAASHLADCDECRGAVVNLTRAAGTEAEIEKRAAAVASKTSEPERRRSWLAALFSPAVLRYAAPALAVCLVAAVTFVALRSRRAGDRPALETAKSSAPREGVAEDQTVVNTNGALQTSSAAASNANVAATSAATNSAANHAATANEEAGKPGQAARESTAGDTASAAPTTVTDRLDQATPAPPKDAPAAGETKPAQGETAKATSGEDKEKNAQEGESERAAAEQPQQRQVTNNLSRAEAQQQTPDGSRNQARTVNGPQNSAGVAGGVAAGNRKDDRYKTDGAATAPAPRRGRSTDEKRAKTEDDRSAADEDEVAHFSNTRSVAGHRFRRDGGAWVDVNYKPSMSSTGVRRGTDQYRALVADLPELGRIAEQLGGEVVAVIKGRAYRIR